MSTLKVTNIESPSGGGISAKINDIGGGQLSNRNLIINGAMQVAQRGTSADTSTNNSYPAIDRFRTSLDVATGVTNVNFSQQTVTDLDGFTNCYRISSNQSRTAALSGGDRLWLQQAIEAQNLQHLNAGKADAKALTLSFYLRSSITSGSVGLEITMSDSPVANQAYYYSVTVPGTADTWQKYTVPIAGNTGGAIDKDNGVGLLVSWQFAAGPTFVGGSRTEGVWTSNAVADVRAPSNNIDLFEDLNDYVDITGVQLEVGNLATSFEHRSYGDELARCQRYFYRVADGASQTLGLGVNYTSSKMHCAVPFPVTMRLAPTLDAASGASYYEFIRNGGADYFNSLTLDNRTTKNIGELYNETEISGTSGHGGFVRTDNAAVYVDFIAEL